MTEAVTLFAQGKTRPEVTSYLIDNDEELQKLESEDEELRKKLSNALSTADPMSPRFAVSKYEEPYKLHRQAFRQALEIKYDVLVSQYLQSLADEIQRLTEQREELDYLINNAMEINPTGTSEYLAIINSRGNADKRIEELRAKFIDKVGKEAGITE